ncbi:MAG: tRNA pseudouridine(13) synthase TruD [Planctomycetes bacterium]|nr:tRNA pseudouridine(13) synthase TruD [Planctomycetota bacterium]
MILKQNPDDFQVEELTDVKPGAGPFALYRLDKSGWTTTDALLAVRRRWHIDRRRLSFGGLKDRHAHTTQHFTLFRGPERKLTHQGFTVAYLGQVEAPFTSGNIRGNRFNLVLRAVAEEELSHALLALPQIRDFGVPNYFDDQRFGSVAGGKFVGKAILFGQYEEALRLALAAPYGHDRGPMKKEKAALRTYWGNWTACKEKLPQGDASYVIDHLADRPGDYPGALARLRPELRTLYLSAYQSHLWNRMLSAWLTAHMRPDQLVLTTLRLESVPMHRTLDPDQLALLRTLSLPLASPKATLADDDPRKPFLDDVLREENLTLEQFKLKDLKEIFFSRGERMALCLPEEMSWAPGYDESGPLRRALRLTFTLPRGSYATLIVKRLQTDNPVTRQSPTG